MAEHLSNEIIDLYQRKALNSESRFNADIHLANCRPCRKRIGEGARLQSLYQTVQADLSYVTENLIEHLSDEQIVAHLKKQLDEVEREIVISHLAWCEVCKGEVKEMRSVASQLKGRGESFPIWAALKERVRKAWERSNQPLSVRVAKAFAGLMLVLAVPYFLWLTFLSNQGKEDSAANVSRKVPSATPEEADKRAPLSATPTATVAPQSNPPAAPATLSWLLPNDRRLVDRAFDRGELELAPALSGMRDTNMGVEERNTFRLLGPGSVVIREAQPTIKWQRLEGASRYNVIVKDLNEDKEVANLFVTGTQWKPDQALERGHRYTWQIIADKAGEEVYGVWPNRNYADFFLIAQDELRRVGEAEKRYKDSDDPLAHIALAARYAKAGLIDAAARELKAFPKQNPHSPLAARLLNDLKRKTAKR